MISLGQLSYDAFQKKIQNENYHVSDNILLVPFAPKLEILKRASLFVAHCGMNRTPETVHFGVPIKDVPQMGDQFFGRLLFYKNVS